jgi:hypothetical protein
MLMMSLQPMVVVIAIAQVPDEAATKCRNCNTVFSAFNRRVCVRVLSFVQNIIICCRVLPPDEASSSMQSTQPWHVLPSGFLQCIFMFGAKNRSEWETKDSHFLKVLYMGVCMYVCLQHHCRNCGDVFCDSCTRGRTTLTAEPDAEVVRVCDRCLVGIHTWNHGFVCCGGGGP